VVSFTESPLSSGNRVCTEPLPKVRLPTTRARLLSRSAAASTSEALAEPASTSTTTGAPLQPIARGRVESRLSPIEIAARVLTMPPLSSRSSAICTADQQSTGIAAQIQHQSTQAFGAGLLQAIDRLVEIAGGGGLETADAHVAEARFQHPLNARCWSGWWRAPG
jgi:hypothetical protein